MAYKMKCLPCFNMAAQQMVPSLGALANGKTKTPMSHALALKKHEINQNEPHPYGSKTFGAFCLDVWTSTFCQLVGFPYSLLAREQISQPRDDGLHTSVGLLLEVCRPCSNTGHSLYFPSWGDARRWMADKEPWTSRRRLRDMLAG